MNTGAEEQTRMILALRRGGVSDGAVLKAIEMTPRECFVPEVLRHYAYDNSALPIDAGQTISQPLVVGLMTQLLMIDGKGKLLEIGTGSGYQAAVLSRLCRQVYTVERIRQLLRQAEQQFRQLDCRNIVTRLGDGRQGWPEQAPFDRIMVTAATPDIPTALVDQLKPDGKLVLPVGATNGEQTLIRLCKDADGNTREEAFGSVRFVPLRTGVAPDP